MSEWFDIEIDVLKSCWIAGASARQIANALGRTRNSVIGKANRLVEKGELQPRGNPGAAVRKAKSSAIAGISR